MKPDIDYCYTEMTFHLKPWKNKVDKIVVLWDEHQDRKEFINEMIQGLKKEGLHKRRTIFAVTVGWRMKVKL